MNKRLLLIVLSALPLSFEASGKSLEADLSHHTVKTYEQIEITMADTFRPSNPHDFNEIVVEGIFLSPDGARLTMPGFYYQPYVVKDGRIVERGKPVWKVRFMPIVSGNWTGEVRTIHRGQTIESDPIAFKATESDHPGLIRVSKVNHYALEYENGRPFFSFGANICDHYPDKQLNAFDVVHDSIDRVDDMSFFTSKLKEHNALFPRFRIDDSRMGIEAIVCPASYEGIGRYHQRTSWEIDRCVQDAARQGTAYLLCVYSGANLRPRYDRNVFWTRFGGPVEKTEDIWTSEECLDYFKRKIRYCVARWGASPGVGVWEIYNEILIGHAVTPKERRGREAFQRKLSAYFKEIDPYKRLVTTNPHGPLLEVETFTTMMEDPNIDLVDYHIYNAEDFAVEVQRLNEFFRARLRKPIVITEYGASTQLFNQSVHGSAKYDPQGIFLHNGAWASVMTGATGIHPWFLKKHLHPMDLYDETYAVADFVKDWKYNETEWKPVNLVVNSRISADEDRWGSYIPTRVSMWQTELLNLAKHKKVYTVNRNGTVQDTLFLNAMLSSSHTPDGIGFRTDYPVNGTFKTHIEKVSVGRGNKISVTISVDGTRRAVEVFHADYTSEDAGIDPFHPKTVVLEVPVEKGEHLIEVLPEGEGRIQIAYEFTNYLDRETENYRAYALGDGRGNIIAWIKNAAYTYSNIYFQRNLPMSLPAAIQVPVPQDGSYLVDWHDTYGGGMTKLERYEARAGHLTLDWRGSERDVALKIRPDNGRTS
jgi:hypothetical protein